MTIGEQWIDIDYAATEGETCISAAWVSSMQNNVAWLRDNTGGDDNIIRFTPTGSDSWSPAFWVLFTGQPIRVWSVNAPVAQYQWGDILAGGVQFGPAFTWVLDSETGLYYAELIPPAQAGRYIKVILTSGGRYLWADGG